MKVFAVLLSALLLFGCATHRKGFSRYDAYDAVKVDEMVGNNVSQTVFAKTIVCLNARRETRRVTALTNTLVTSVTNQTINGITNQTVSVSTNFLFTVVTNLSPAITPLPIQPVGDNAASGSETNTNVVAVVLNVSPAMTTNFTVSVGNNASATVAPNQRTANNQLVRTMNNQLTTTSNNLSVSVMTNLVVTAETNQTVNYLTNTAIVAVTNMIVAPTNGVAYDYFLYSELIPPPEFTLAPGESLILLVDGVRYGFTPGQSGTGFAARKGYTSTLYRVPPEALVAIANAKEVRIRFKGVTTLLERKMSASSQSNFRAFVSKYFVPEPSVTPEQQVAAEANTVNR